MTNKTSNQTKTSATAGATKTASSQKNEAQTKQVQKTSTDSLFKSTSQTNNTPDTKQGSLQNTTKAKVEPEPKEKKSLPVDINISGKVYSINCPADEVDDLKSAAKYINNFIQDIRKGSPQLTHENLLVLCCLNLYEHMQETKKDVAVNEKASKEANTLVDKMIKDMQIV